MGRHSYNDATLTRLIEAGMVHNLDTPASNEGVRAAQANVTATLPLAAHLRGYTALATFWVANANYATIFVTDRHRRAQQ